MPAILRNVSVTDINLVLPGALVSYRNLLLFYCVAKISFFSGDHFEDKEEKTGSTSKYTRKPA